MTRRAAIGRRALLAGAPALALAACATARPGSSPAPTVADPVRPGFAQSVVPALRLGPERLTRITVCTRPFRAAGPRLDVEEVVGKRVVHNYGHGGSGWSLAWGSAEIAAQRAIAGGTKRVAVIGCGAMGLTTAVTLQRAGAAVTIYAAERTPETRSARATGMWSPDSRVASADRVGLDFAGLWDAMARVSYRAHQSYLGLPGDPVEFRDRYLLRSDAASAAPGPDDVRFFTRRLAEQPRSRELAPEEHPFPVRDVRLGSGLQFNVAALVDHLTAEFRQSGGIFVRRTFREPADLAPLPEPVVVNCTGYGARALWRDDSLVPIRGQIGWLAPQPEARYGVLYAGTFVVTRPDGVAVQSYRGDMDGYGSADETPDPAETEAALARVRPLFA